MKPSRFQKKEMVTRTVGYNDLIGIVNTGLAISITEEIRKGDDYQIAGTLSDPTGVARSRTFTAQLSSNQYVELIQTIKSGQNRQ